MSRRCLFFVSICLLFVAVFSQPAGDSLNMRLLGEVAFTGELNWISTNHLTKIGNYAFFATLGSFVSVNCEDNAHPEIIGGIEAYFCINSWDGFLYGTGPWGPIRRYSIENPALPVAIDSLFVSDYGYHGCEIDSGIVLVYQDNYGYALADFRNPEFPVLIDTVRMDGICDIYMKYPYAYILRCRASFFEYWTYDMYVHAIALDTMHENFTITTRKYEWDEPSAIPRSIAVSDSYVLVSYHTDGTLEYDYPQLTEIYSIYNETHSLITTWDIGLDFPKIDGNIFYGYRFIAEHDSYVYVLAIDDINNPDTLGYYPNVGDIIRMNDSIFVGIGGVMKVKVIKLEGMQINGRGSLDITKDIKYCFAPNPISNGQRVNLDKTLTSPELFDITGKKYNIENRTIDASKLAAGVYLLKGNIGGQRVVKKIVVE
jgi:hypothetical protein